jgi:hypothetical protein
VYLIAVVRKITLFLAQMQIFELLIPITCACAQSADALNHKATLQAASSAHGMSCTAQTGIVGADDHFHCIHHRLGNGLLAAHL